MAAIDRYIQQIREAIYGKDVREAIASGIEQCYSDNAIRAETAASQAVQAASQAVQAAEGIVNYVNMVQVADDNYKIVVTTPPTT